MGQRGLVDGDRNSVLFEIFVAIRRSRQRGLVATPLEPAACDPLTEFRRFEHPVLLNVLSRQLCRQAEQVPLGISCWP